MKKHLLKIVLLSLMVFTYYSCVQEPDNPDDNPITEGKKVLLVLNEGLFNMNNSTITYFNYDDSTAVTDYFAEKNSRGLGDTGNDMKLHGGKIYIAVTTSSLVEIMDAKTGVSLRQIPMFDDTKPRQPRYVCCYKDKAFVSCFDGNVAVIDTLTLQVEQYIKVGANPDGLVAVNDYLFVANSGGLNNPNYDSTVSVINLQNYQEIKKITVAINPYIIVPDKYGDLYVVTRGNYGNIPYQLHIVNSATLERTHTFADISILNMCINDDNDIAYAYSYDFNTGKGNVITFNVRTEQLVSNNFISDNTKIKTLYGIAIDKETGDVYISDAKDFTNTGFVYCFDKDGKQKFNFEAGLNPSKMVFMKN
ncbi:MAG: YncE family protein [Bacteroidales bacterium]|jgi:DNA-binding beta-propeller fold protein YncE